MSNPEFTHPETQELKETNRKKVVVELGSGSASNIFMGYIPETALPVRMAGSEAGYNTMDLIEEKAVAELFYSDLKSGKANYIGIDKTELEDLHDAYMPQEVRDQLPQNWEKSIKFVRGDAYKIPLADNSVDTIIMREPQFDVTKASDEIWRVLRADGNVAYGIYESKGFRMNFTNNSVFKPGLFRYARSAVSQEEIERLIKEGKFVEFHNYYIFNPIKPE